MSAGKFLLLGVAAAGVALLLLNKSANASPSSRLPDGWIEPPNAEHTTLPAGTMGVPFVVERVMWRNANSGAVPGIFMTLSAGPSDWVTLFTPDGSSTVGLISKGAGSRSNTIAKAAGVQGL